VSDRQPELYEIAIRGAWHLVDIYGGGDRFIQTFASVPAWQGALFAAHLCQSEVRNGGLHQFFTNPSGVLAPEASAGLRAMGLSEAAAVLDRAMAAFGSPYPRETADRQEILARVAGEARSEWDPFYSMDPLFYAALGGVGESDLFADAARAFVQNR
jgi:hypothetical protein